MDSSRAQSTIPQKAPKPSRAGFDMSCSLPMPICLATNHSRTAMGRLRASAFPCRFGKAEIIGSQ